MGRDRSGILVQFIGPQGGRGSRRKFRGKDVPRLAAFVGRLIGLGKPGPAHHDLLPGRVRDGKRTWSCGRCKRVTDPVPKDYSQFQARLTVALDPERWSTHCGTEFKKVPPGVDPPPPCCGEMGRSLSDGTVREGRDGFLITRSHQWDPLPVTNCPWCGAELRMWSGMAAPAPVAEAG